MPGLIRKHFVYGQLWLLKYCGQHAARIGLDCICLIQLPACNSVLFFQRRHGSYCAKPIWIWSGWPDQVLGKRISSGSKLVGKNHTAQFLAECNWPATSFPLSDSVAFSHRWPRSHCAQPAWVQSGSGWLCQVLAKWNWSRSKPMCKNNPACFWSSMFTGKVHLAAVMCCCIKGAAA